MHDIYVVSDLHMGRGKNPETRRFFTLENFFWDEDFQRFCQYLCRNAQAREKPFKLLLNGDTFDLLRIEPDPTHDPTSLHERRFGPAHTPSQAAKTVGQILAGHPRFVQGIVDVLAAGYDVIILPGNHDIEVQWQPVQEEIRQCLLKALIDHQGEPQAHKTLEHLSFQSWFYHEPGRVWIEHGCQYDPENSFRYLLRENLVTMPDVLHQTEQDMPLGNFFQRYLYNFFGHITFIVPSTRANLRYLRWLLLHQPRLLLRVAFSHLPFMFQVLRRLRQVHKSKTARDRLHQVHHESLSQWAVQSGLKERLLAIDQLKEVRADAVQAMGSILWQLARLLCGSLLFLVLTASLWFLGFHAINELRSGLGLKAFLFLFLDLLIIGCTFGTILYYTLGQNTDVPARPLRRAAQKIVNILDVPIVSFGHSHDEELWRLERPSEHIAWYCNTGTWVTVFTHDVLLPRERVQYTFLRIQEYNAELMHWSPGRGEPMPVILLDEQEN